MDISKVPLLRTVYFNPLNPIAIIALTGAISTWLVSPYPMALGLVLVFAQCAYKGSIARVFVAEPVAVLLPIFLGFVAVTWSGFDRLADCIMRLLVLASLLAGLFIAEWASEDDVVKGLLSIRTIAITGCLFSLVFEQIGNVTLDMVSTVGYSPFQFYERYPGREFISFFGHHILLGLFLSIALAVTLFLSKNKIELISTACLFIWGIYNSNARSAWITIILMMICAFVLWGNKMQWRIWDRLALMVIPIAVLVFICINSGYVDEILDRYSTLSNSAVDRSYSFRSEAFFYGLTAFFKHPQWYLFGCGYWGESSVLAYVRLGGMSDAFLTFDNGYLSLVYMYGIVGFVLFARAIAHLFKMVLRKWSMGCALCIISCTVVLLVQTCFFNIFGWYSSGSLIMLLIGIGISDMRFKLSSQNRKNNNLLDVALQG